MKNYSILWKTSFGVACLAFCITLVFCIHLDKKLELAQRKEQRYHLEVQILYDELKTKESPAKSQLDSDYEEEMKTALTTLDMTNVTLKYGDKWKKEMDDTFYLVQENLSNDLQGYLTNAQDSWEVRIQDDEELLYQINDKMHHGGSIMQFLNAQIYLDRYRDRTATLKRYYEAAAAYR